MGYYDDRQERRERRQDKRDDVTSDYHRSPYEVAEEREPGSGQALLDASDKYYDEYPQGHPDLANDPSLAVNWYDPDSYSWMYNTAQTAAPTPTPTPGPTPTPSDQDTAPGSYAGYGRLPTPKYSQMPRPERPEKYYSTYQPEWMQKFTGVGQDQRNRLMNAILQNPETMGQVQQDQLFEQQKEMLNLQRQQQAGVLNQNLLRGGMSAVGGRALSGIGEINQDFNSQLLAGRRDIAVMAAQQNRADTMAALQMQDALAQGDFTRVMGVYKANQSERMNTENFLRQAAAMRQSGTLGWNAQNLSASQAQHSAMMNYYEFLEQQRQYESDYNLNKWKTGVIYG